jgi:hypothetical protein
MHTNDYGVHLISTVNLLSTSFKKRDCCHQSRDQIVLERWNNNPKLRSMLDHFCCEGVQRCTTYGESPRVFAEFVFVGFKVRLVFLGLGALVSGTDDVPWVGVWGLCRFPWINRALYGFWIRFSLLTGLFFLFYNEKAELLLFTVQKKKQSIVNFSRTFYLEMLFSSYVIMISQKSGLPDIKKLFGHVILYRIYSLRS